MTKSRDEEITGRVIAGLAASPDVTEQNINIQTVGGRVRLAGVVDTLVERNIADGIARATKGVTLVENHLVVDADGDRRDIWIERQVNDRLSKDPNLTGVGAKSTHGTVMLMGTLPTLALEQQAIAVAGSVKGVGEVVTDIGIAAGEPVDDIRLANDVVEALSDDTRLDARDVHAETKNGEVRIFGEVDTDRERQIATEVSAEIPGVKRVRNEMIVSQATVAWTGLDHSSAPR